MAEKIVIHVKCHEMRHQFSVSPGITCLQLKRIIIESHVFWPVVSELDDLGLVECLSTRSLLEDDALLFTSCLLLIHVEGSNSILANPFF